MMLTVGHLQILGSCDNIAFQRAATDPHICSLVSMSPCHLDTVCQRQTFIKVSLDHGLDGF